MAEYRTIDAPFSRRGVARLSSQYIHPPSKTNHELKVEMDTRVNFLGCCSYLEVGTRGIGNSFSCTVPRQVQPQAPVVTESDQNSNLASFGWKRRPRLERRRNTENMEDSSSRGKERRMLCVWKRMRTKKRVERVPLIRGSLGDNYCIQICCY